MYIIPTLPLEVPTGMKIVGNKIVHIISLTSTVCRDSNTSLIVA